MSSTPAEPAHLPPVGVVILTQGTRPVELARALESVAAQRGVAVDVVVVGNGWAPAGLPPGVRSVHLPVNVGVGGRNHGVGAVRGDLLFFLDDDAWLPAPDTLARVAQIFVEHPAIGMVQSRLSDPEVPTAPRYWVPRLRKGDPARSSTVMHVLEASVAIRRELFEGAGGWPADFRYAHEGIELAWRVWDAGYLVWYAGDIETHHPAILPTRHAEYQRLNARNRVWLARRNLPWLVGAAYLSVWGAVEWARARHDPQGWQVYRKGWREGWQEDPGPRRPLHLRTVLEMARHGRPPVV